MNGVIIGLLSGLAFGYVISRVGATDPDKMARSHLMEDSAIPKFMLTAVLFAAVGLSGLVAVGAAITSVLPLSLIATSLAGILFGVGWGLAGYCPGTSWAAAGEGRLDAIAAVLGGLCGTAVFAQLHDVIIPAFYDPTNLGRLTLMDVFGGSRAVATIVLVVALALAIWIVSKLWGRSQDVG